MRAKFGKVFEMACGAKVRVYPNTELTWEGEVSVLFTISDESGFALGSTVTNACLLEGSPGAYSGLKYDCSDALHTIGMFATDVTDVAITLREVADYLDEVKEEWSWTDD